jgi:RNA polymerase sigma factor (sigma-70 family)
VTRDSLESELEVIERAIQGESRAWATLVETYSPLVWSVCRGCGLDSADAEDVSQVVFTALLRRLPFLEDASRISGWIIVTAKRESWRVSAVNRRRSSADPSDHDQVFHDPDSELLERQQAVRSALEILDARCRTLLWEVFGTLDTPSYDQLATRLGLHTNSIGPTKRRCLDALLETLLDRSAGLFLQ